MQAVSCHTDTLRRIAIETAHQRKGSLEAPVTSSTTGLNRYMSEHPPAGDALDWSSIASSRYPNKTGHDLAVRLSRGVQLIAADTAARPLTPGIPDRRPMPFPVAERC